MTRILDQNFKPLILQINLVGLLFDDLGLSIDTNYLSPASRKAMLSPNFRSDEECVKAGQPFADFRQTMFFYFASQFGDLDCSITNFAVGKITYALSLLISSNFTLRERFFAAYGGPIPAITQMLLNIFRTGQLADGHLLADYFVYESSFDKIRQASLTRSFLHSRTVDRIDMYLKHIVLWFTMLDRLDNQSKLGYFENYVQLKKVAICSNSTISFPGLIIDNNTAYWYKSCERLELDLKKNLQMISASLDSKLYTFDDFEGIDEWKHHDWSAYKETVDVNELLRQLLHFIFACQDPDGDCQKVE